MIRSIGENLKTSLKWMSRETCIGISLRSYRPVRLWRPRNGATSAIVGPVPSRASLNASEIPDLWIRRFNETFLIDIFLKLARQAAHDYPIPSYITGTASGYYHRRSTSPDWQARISAW